MYHAIGRAAIRFSLRYLRSRYRRQLRIGVALVALGAGVALFLAAREVREG